MYWDTAIERSELDKILSFIRMGFDVNCVNSNLESGLHICARLGHVEASQILFMAGAHVSPVNQLGYTPIQLAARYDTSPDMCMLLLKNGADPYQKNKYGKSALDYARSYGRHAPIHEFQVAQKWRAWTRRRILEREKQFARKIWNHFNISCHLNSIIQFF